jgi:hypothetical protein
LAIFIAKIWNFETQKYAILKPKNMQFWNSKYVSLKSTYAIFKVNLRRFKTFPKMTNYSSELCSFLKCPSQLIYAKTIITNWRILFRFMLNLNHDWLFCKKLENNVILKLISNFGNLIKIFNKFLNNVI